MHYRDGIIWAGLNELVFSADTGRTWSKTNFGKNDEILDVSFLNSDTGVVAASSGVYLTRDRGQTWTISLSAPNLRRIIYDPHASTIFALQQNACRLFSSTDGGNSWNSQTLVPTFGYSMTTGSNGSYYLLGSGEVLASTDRGVTWSPTSTQIKADSYSIDVDSCDENRLYVANEDFVYQSDGPSRIFVSSDLGNTWNVNYSHPVRYLSGAFASGPHSHYATSCWDGLIRSTDQGTTWTNIGGPKDVLYDGRNICAVNDNIIFVLDSSGSIWATFNSGGDSILESNFTSTLSATASTLFASDTLSCDSLTHSVLFTRTGCSPPSVAGWSIIGLDSANFQASNLSFDSILVTLYAMKQGDQHAQLVLTLDNGSSDTVTLAGHVRASPFKYAVSPQQIFDGDSVYPCEGPSNETVYLNTSGCKLPDILSESISGNSSMDYMVTKSINNFTGFDSIEFTFSPSDTGIRNAAYVMTLSDGSNITILLSGYGIPAIPLLLATSDQTTDTLGATVSVPITLNGLERAENVDLVLHYDGTVDYLGSFSPPPSGVRLDIPGDSSLGRSVLSITGATSGAVLGYAKFNVFNDSNEAAHATLDSVTVLTQTSPCEYSMPDSATSTITTLSGCAISILSQLIHLDKEPVLSVVPNPANGNVWISSSDDLGAVTIEIYDMLGTCQVTLSTQMTKENPFELLLPAKSGVYNILVRSAAGTRTLRVVREN